MRGDNPPHQYIPLYCSQPSQAQLDSEAELYYFPPIRDGNSTPQVSSSIPVYHSPPRSQAAQQALNGPEDELSSLPSIQEGNDTPTVPPISARSHPQVTQRVLRRLPSSSKGGPSQSRRRQQLNMGLGAANIVNTVEVRLYTLYRSLY